MVKIKSVLIYLIEFLFIFCCITCTAFGINSNDSKSIQSGDLLNSEVSNVNFDYYNCFFGLNSYGNTVITRCGKLPVLETNEQKERWNSTLEELSNRIKDPIISKYMYPHGEVVTCGANTKGYFVILFKYGNVDEPLMNEIYVLIDDSAKEMGIQDVPVEFGYGTYRQEITLDPEQGIYYWFGESMENLSESDIHTVLEVMKGKPTTPVQKIVAAYGKIPLLKDQNEIITWADKLSAIADSTQDKIYPYVERGQVIIYGRELTRLEIGINETLPPKEKNTIVKEVYEIIDKEARKQNVTDVPVIFDEGVFINQVASADLGVVQETANLSASKEKNASSLNILNNNNSNNGSNSSENKSSEINSTPGFGLLGSLTCVCGARKLRKK